MAESLPEIHFRESAVVWIGALAGDEYTLTERPMFDPFAQS